ncbi:nicotinamide-nucleotide amidase [Sphingobacterium allocomposti]|jgi:PncC family amidohydrolase|uniref:Nicotinamide-nucleotide amidase n=1 Tax=Sphingobacterium allocomposti TaxID=415956 RepID=A0A5S5DCW5_9SPHI|nr:nicotinamide-nucleotide amidohydrolase family protein [Sphingobacterium composti Yoo et al. 2007 non Ten et al. 2007]TYP92459.1 nicotinamide-nucleotide amidase [Sphingobacterium composti Yoo et al. 2007 non Ten et al. 2007]HLS95923.1 nicotinamide-nucleotide amidohydrolase family protein [Sphingobacterium sp.]
MQTMTAPLQTAHINTEMLDRCGEFLKEHGLKLLCAESMTAGFLGSLWAMEVHSGDYFLGSMVTYDDVAKNYLLSVPPSKIKKYCAESAVVTLRMLDGLRQRIPEADVLVSITGLAFKSTNEKQRRPVGTVYYAFQYHQEKVIYRKAFSGDAGGIFIATCNAVLDDLYGWLTNVVAA